MTFSAPRPVVSGKPYQVRQVLGHEPRDLSDFAGQTTFDLHVDSEVDSEGQDYTVMGIGVRIDDAVEVFEKDEQGHGKDFRVWTVRHTGSSTSFTAEHRSPWRRQA
jgi:hypothetical protein